MDKEPFVPADVAANFLGIKRRLLLAMARKGVAGAYPLGTGDLRKTWVFRMSELIAALGPRTKNVILYRDHEWDQSYPMRGSPR